MEYKFLNFEVKSETDGNKITGYGSIYGNIDQGGDIVADGAFAHSLAAGRIPKMLFQHSHDSVIGKWTSVVDEPGTGLKLEGIIANTPRGNEIKELVKMGAISGLSIGYKIIDATRDSQGHRIITKADLWEVSVVTFPMNESATIIDLKKADSFSKRDMEIRLRDAGFSRKCAAALLSGGYDALQNQRDSDNIEEVKAIEVAQLKEIKGLLVNILQNK